MSKGHRDNHAARLKRGAAAFQKKAKRRSGHGRTKCNLCGTDVRSHKLFGGLCPPCAARATAQPPL